MKTFIAICGIFLASSVVADIKVGALGDSITAGVNCGKTNCREHFSWATGKEIESHAERLGAVHVANLAVSGARSTALLEQVTTLISEMRPDYVTILVGANDLCSWGPGESDTVTGIEVFKQSVNTAISTLISVNAGMSIKLLGVPDLERMYEVNKDRDYCRFIWHRFNICPRLLQGDDAARAKVVADWIQLNDAIAEIASSFSQVEFLEASSAASFEREHVSHIDCFHPSVEGHKLLSELTFGGR